MARTGLRTFAEKIAEGRLVCSISRFEQSPAKPPASSRTQGCEDALAIASLLRQRIRVCQDRPKEEREEEDRRQQEGWVDPPGHRGERQVHEPHDHEGEGQPQEKL